MPEEFYYQFKRSPVAVECPFCTKMQAGWPVMGSEHERQIPERHPEYGVLTIHHRPAIAFSTERGVTTVPIQLFKDRDGLYYVFMWPWLSIPLSREELFWLVEKERVHAQRQIDLAQEARQKLIDELYDGIDPNVAPPRGEG